MLPLIVFGLVSGWYMDRNKRRRRALPLGHGLADTILLGLSLSQIYTGWRVLETLVLID